MSCRRLNVLKMRSPHGSAAWDGTGWGPCSGGRPRCCGAIPSQACVCGACCCWPTVAAAALSFPSEGGAHRCSSPNTWPSLKQDFLYALLGRGWDGPLLSEAVLHVWVTGRQAVGPQCITTYWKFVSSLPYTDVDPTPLVCTSTLNNWNIVF